VREGERRASPRRGTHTTAPQSSPARPIRHSSSCFQYVAFSNCVPFILLQADSCTHIGEEISRNMSHDRPFGRPAEMEARPWTTSSSSYGSYFQASAPRNVLAVVRPLHFEPPQGSEKLTSEGLGSFYSTFKPMARPRPVSQTTILMRNRAIYEGKTSSEVFGQHTGMGVHRNLIGGRPPPTPPIFERLHNVTNRMSDVIGKHPPSPPLDVSNIAKVHAEANFSRRFPSHASSRRPEAVEAINIQDRLVTRAAQLNSNARVASSILQAVPNETLPVMRESASSLPSPANTFHGKKLQSAMISCVPNIDPRRQYARPESLPYGSSTSGQPHHEILTPRGTRRVLPTRSTMPIGSGSPIESKHRCLDF
jgi:hypothetical protein